MRQYREDVMVVRQDHRSVLMRTHGCTDVVAHINTSRLTYKRGREPQGNQERREGAAPRPQERTSKRKKYVRSNQHHIPRQSK